MALAVVDEVPEYSAFAPPAVRQMVVEHSLDQVHAIVRAIRTCRLPSTEGLVSVRERALVRATLQPPVSALNSPHVRGDGRGAHSLDWHHKPAYLLPPTVNPA
jgi:hypothetical protein